MKNSKVFKKSMAILLAAIMLLSCFVGTISVSAESFSITKTYINLFDDEASTTDSEVTSIADIYAYLDYAPSAYHGSYITNQTARPSSKITTSYGKTHYAEPAIDWLKITDEDDSTVPTNYGKNSLGSMLLRYPSEQVSGQYSHFRIWDNQSSNAPFDADGKAKQVIEATNNTTVYRVSFDYKAEIPEGYTGGIYYYNGQNSASFADSNLDQAMYQLTEVADIKDTAGEWVNSGYTYVTTQAWMVAALCLKMDDNEKSAGTKVWIDNLKLEQLNKSSTSLSFVNVTFMDGEKAVFSKSVPAGGEFSIPAPSKDGYVFGGWKDADGNSLISNNAPETDVTYYADWEYVGCNITKTYITLFDNEASKTNPEVTSIADIYAYLDYAPSAYHGSYITSGTERPKSAFGTSYGKTHYAEPAIDWTAITNGTTPVNYGKDSLGSMLLRYPSAQASGSYSHFKIWDNQSSNAPFDTNGVASQVIVGTDNTTVYRVSFDYKAEVPEGYTGGIYYYNGQNNIYFGDSNLNQSYYQLTEVADIKDTAGEWVHSGYSYVTSQTDMASAICLKMDDNEKSAGTKVWIDNLKLEVTDVTPESLVTVTFKDGDSTIKTIKGLPGTAYTVTELSKDNYIFNGYVDSDNNAVTSFVIPNSDITYYSSWTISGYKVTKTYTNLFDNEASKTNSEVTSIADIYAYLDYAPSAYHGSYITNQTARPSVKITTSYGKTHYAEPAIDWTAITNGTTPVNYGKDSLGSMLLRYPSAQVSGQYSHFRIWDNQSANMPFGESGTDNAKQVIEATNDNTVYRISFDYKAEVPEGYTGGIYYYNGQNSASFADSNLDQAMYQLTEVADIKDTAGEWVHSGYTYVTSKAWMVAALCLKMDDNEKSAGTKVWIDNLKLEVIDATADKFSSMITFTFMDGEEEISTVKGLFGLDSYVENPEKYGYKFVGWTDAQGNSVEIDKYFETDKTYYASWLFEYLNIKGDINGDNYVNINDLVRLKKFLAEIEGVDVEEENAFFTEYEDDVFKLVALKRYLISGIWAYPISYAQSDASYKYVWGDEFNDATLDTNTWQISTYTKDTDTVKYSSDSDVLNVKDGYLTLNTIVNEDGTYKTSTSVDTKMGMNFKYGYMELKANVPLTKGSSPSFWFQGLNGAWTGESLIRGECEDYLTEIDVFEGDPYDADNRSIVPNIHKWFKDTETNGTNTNYNAVLSSNGEGDQSYKFDADQMGKFHIYGFKWTPEKITMFVDGEQYAEYDITKKFDSNDKTDMSGFQDPMYLILSCGFFTADHNKLEENISYTIDWVRLFQAEGSELYTAE